jgi:hypothetical protein
MDPSWLSVLREDMHRITSQAARRHWPGPSQAVPPFFNYRWEHVQQVERDPRRLLQRVTADEEIVLAAVWLHDRFQPQYDDDGHAARAADWARSQLAGCGFPPAKVAVVAGAVAEHSGAPGTIPEDRLEARLLWDADKLSRLGAVNLISYLAAMPAFPSPLMGFDSILAVGKAKLSSKRALADAFYLDVSRRLARQRLELQQAFNDELAAEMGE